MLIACSPHQQALHHPCRYFFSTLLSLWNRTLLGKGHGVLGKGAFPGLAFSCCMFVAACCR